MIFDDTKWNTDIKLQLSLNNAGVRGIDPRVVKNPFVTFDSPKT